MSDFEKLQNAILQEAREKAKAIVDEGKQEEKAIINDAQNETSRFKKEGEETARRKGDELKKRMISSAQRELETRILETKHAQTRLAFERTKDAIKTMPPKDYQQFITELVMGEELAEGNYEVVVSEGDTKRITQAFVKKLSARLKEKGVALSYSGKTAKTAKIAGGIILRGEDIEENLSIDSLLRMEKETLVSEAMSSLFPETREGEDERSEL